MRATTRSLRYRLGAAAVGVVAVAALASASARLASGGSRVELANTNWQIVSVTGPNGSTTAIPEATVATFSFLDGRHAVGWDSVSPWQANYAVHGADVTFTSAKTGASGMGPGDPVADALRAATQACLDGRPVRTHRTATGLTMESERYTLTLRATAHPYGHP